MGGEREKKKGERRLLLCEIISKQKRFLNICLRGKVCPLMQPWHKDYGVTNSFYLGFEACSTGGNSCLILQTRSRLWLTGPGGVLVERHLLLLAS